MKNTTATTPSLKNANQTAALWTLFWVVLALIATFYIYLVWGIQPAKEFISGYLIEKLLSIDNLFVFFAIFKFFRISVEQQHRALNFGLVGAVVARGLFIFLGIQVLEHFHFVIYFLGVFLIATGIHSAVAHRQEEFTLDLESNFFLRTIKGILRIDINDRTNKLFSGGKKWHATRLLLVILVVEFTDVIFAMDSIPAILAITANPWIVYSSNIFAILGLRSLYFFLQGIQSRFETLHYAVSGILIFVGLKMLLNDIFPISTGVSLAMIVLLLVAISWGAGLILNRAPRKARKR